MDNFLQGIGSCANLPGNYYKPEFECDDSEAIKKDWEAICSDYEATIACSKISMKTLSNFLESESQESIF